MRVVIHPAVDVFYYSFYIEGLYRLYGRKNVKFSKEGFPEVYERNFAALIITETSSIKLAIDAFDTRRVNKELLLWCDVYGKVNYYHDSPKTQDHQKIVAIGPSFGIRIWSLPQTLKFAIENFLKVRQDLFFKRDFLANFWRQYKRMPLKSYMQERKVDQAYIFFVSSLWKKEQETNVARASFIEAAKGVSGVKFEGGFAPRTDGADLGFGKQIYKRISFREYLGKIGRSLLVFNTPAVDNCHGWKLPEFLAMGKAIISTSITNELPAEINQGKEVHFVKSVSKEEIAAAIEIIRKEPDYRERLEKHSKQYFMDYLLPEIVIERMLANLNYR